jgi:hypothetical protein
VTAAFRQPLQNEAASQHRHRSNRRREEHAEQGREHLRIAASQRGEDGQPEETVRKDEGRDHRQQRGRDQRQRPRDEAG